MAENFYKVRKGVFLTPRQVSDVISPTNGDFYFDSDKNTVTYYINGKWTDVQRRADVPTAASLTSADFTTLVTEATLLKLTGATAGDIHGLEAVADAKLTYLYNGSSAIMVLKHDSATEATPANRILNPDATDVTIFAGQTVVLTYDTTQSRWITLSAPSTGGSASVTKVLFDTPGSFMWVAPAGVFSITLVICGAGGGGGGSGRTTTSGGGAHGNRNRGGGGAGGNGATPVTMTFSVTPGQTYNITIGTGGAGGASASAGVATAGSTGGNSTFDGVDVTVIKAQGATGGGGGTSSGGVGGTPSVGGFDNLGTFKTTGGNGGAGGTSGDCSIVAGAPGVVGGDSQLATGGTNGFGTGSAGGGASGGGGGGASSVEGDGGKGSTNAVVVILAAPTGAVRSSNVVTITYDNSPAANAAFAIGRIVVVAGVTDSSFNGTFAITATGAGTFQYAQVGANATSGSGTARHEFAQAGVRGSGGGGGASGTAASNPGSAGGVDAANSRGGAGGGHGFAEIYYVS